MDFKINILKSIIFVCFNLTVVRLITYFLRCHLLSSDIQGRFLYSLPLYSQRIF